MITLNKLSKACVFSSLLLVSSLATAQTSCVEGWDFQAEYLNHKKSGKHVDNYNLHVHKHFWNNDYLSFYFGGTATIADGYIDKEEKKILMPLVSDLLLWDDWNSILLVISIPDWRSVARCVSLPKPILQAVVPMIFYGE